MQTSAELRPVVAAPVSALLTSAPKRLFWLAALFLGVAAVTWSILGAGHAAPTAHWPTDDDGVFALSGWRASSAVLETANGNTYVTRRLQPMDGASPVTFTLTTSQSVKTVYRAGADVPFLGSGYETQPLSADLLAAAHGRGVSFVRRGDEGWLQLYAYGERRGLTGNGVLGWSLAVFDTVMSQPNDYYLVRVMAPTTTASSDAIQQVSQVADALFPRIADWYARPSMSAALPNLNPTPMPPMSSLNETSLG